MEKAVYGILSDMHEADPRLAGLAIDIFKKKNVDGVVLNGDLVGDRFRGLKTGEYLSCILSYAASSGLETYVLPGSHESVLEFERIVGQFQKSFPNIVYAVEKPKAEKKGHSLVFLGGSDWRPTLTLDTGFAIDEKTTSGLYDTGGGNALRVLNINDLRRTVTEPESTILFSHVPRKFSHGGAVDEAHFIESIDFDFRLGEGKAYSRTTGVRPAIQLVMEYLKKEGKPIMGYGGANPSEEAITKFASKHAKAAGTDVLEVFVEKKENRGNEALKKLYGDLKITKNVTGHFHEANGKAHDGSGVKVKEKRLTEELYWMASYVDGLLAGLLTVSGKEVSYQNIGLKKYLP